MLKRANWSPIMGARGFCQSDQQSNNKLVEKRSEDVSKLKKKSVKAELGWD